MRIWNKNKEKAISAELDMSRIPSHIAIIMDGNGRWAELRGMPRAVGHRAGVEALRGVVRCCDALGVKCLTVYAFSTENWKRPQSEIGILMSLLKEYVRKELAELDANNVLIRVLGDIQQLPPDVREAVRVACEKTKDNTGLTFNLAVNYGGRAELVQAIKSIVREAQNGRLNPEKIDEKVVENYLYTGGCPEPELLIRTSGEMRISNFLLWQAAYSEFVVVNECWPDFNEKSLLEAVRVFQSRDRRFGGIKKVEE